MFKGDHDAIEKLIKLSTDIMVLSRNTLIVNLRFMDSVISRLQWKVDNVTIAVDGKNLYYDPVHILRLYKKEKELPIRNYLHSIFHCVFQHFYISTLLDQRCWNLACDIAVENVINELKLACVETLGAKEQRKVIGALKGKVKYLTAETLYRYFLDGNLSESEIQKLSNLFSADDHYIWYLPPEDSEGNTSPIDGDQSNDDDSAKDNQNSNSADNQNSNSAKDNQNSNSADNRNNCLSKDKSPNDQNIEDFNDNKPGNTALELLKKEWKEISEQMKMDLETFSKRWGTESEGLTQNLLEINRERYDYTDFLKKFAVFGETMIVNDDEFDYIFYTYGLKMYEKMPLIEPLEYKDVKKIKEFVIAIDTSGSTSGELVQMFLQKTYNILMQQENFFTKINVHIIQCDTEIQEDVKITNLDEFEQYMKSMVIRGLGGTDFRPVFSYVDRLIDNGEFTNLKGLIYFTDGYGVFPKKQPSYHSAVIYIDEGFNNPEVPVWAIKLVLREDEI